MSDQRSPHDPYGPAQPPVQGPHAPAQGPYPAQYPPSVAVPPLHQYAPYGSPLQAGPAYDPTAASSGAPDIRNYAAPKPRTSMVVALLAAVALIGLIAVLVLQRAGAAPTPVEPTASAAGAGSPGQPFSMPSDPDSTGSWEVVEREWSGDGVSVHVRIYATAGTISYGFAVFEAGSTQTTSPAPGPRDPELRSGVLRAGETVDGWVFLPIRRGEATLFLTTSAGRAYSAQAIPG